MVYPDPEKIGLDVYTGWELFLIPLFSLEIPRP